VSALKYFPAPLIYVGPLDDNTAPQILDGRGALVASLFWPGHPKEETEAAEIETEQLGKTMAAAHDLKIALIAYRKAQRAMLEGHSESSTEKQLQLWRNLHDCENAADEALFRAGVL
jgi:hypothetical protein